MSARPLDPAQRFLTIPQVAAELGVTPRTVWNWIGGGLLPTHRFVGAVRVSRADLESFIARGRNSNDQVQKRRIRKNSPRYPEQ